MDESRGDPVDHQAWPARPWLLAALGGAIGFTAWLLIRGSEPWGWTASPFRVASAAFVAVAGLVFAVSLERLRWTWSAAFALAAGLLVASVVIRNGTPSDWGSGEGWQFFSSMLAVTVAVPLFQTVRDEGRWRLTAGAVHSHIWSNLILAAAAAASVLAAILLSVLLAALFELIGIHFVRDLLQTGSFGSAAGGAALGLALGLLRDRDQLLATVQRIVRAILAFLAPLLALGLVLFVLALPFTGLQPLWDQTKATTPILLACILGGVALANAAIGASTAEEPPQRPLRYAAAALCGVILPLAFVAAVSTAKRIGEYGYTPDRLWAAVFVGAAAAVGMAYWIALALGRRAWPARVRLASVRAGIGIFLLALFLALPIVSFGAISTRDQVARLESGKVAPGKFDWAALRFDFGPSGRGALKRLKQSAPTAGTRALAARALAAADRYAAVEVPAEAASLEAAPLRLRTGSGPVPPALRDFLYRLDGGAAPCRGSGECLLFWKPGERSAVALLDGCAASVVGRAHQADRKTDCKIKVTAIVAGGGGGGGEWHEAPDATIVPEVPGGLGSAADHAGLRREREAIDRGDVAIREITRRQVFIGGKPEGPPFE